MNVLVTGARGFIGSAFIRYAVQLPSMEYDEFSSITAFARDGKAWTRPRLEEDHKVQRACERGKLQIVYGDLNGDISGLCENIDCVIHFGAKTFVDHSIRDPKPFIDANVLGTANLLEEARRQGVKTFINVSTDEVYGQILEGKYTESAAINPRNPYAASKAGADALVISYAHTFGMWTAVTRTENNYGPFQHPQKAMPVFIMKGILHRPLPVYGDGRHVRQWLHVQDHVEAILSLLARKDSVNPGEVWHIAGNQEITNNQLAMRILDILKRPHSLIEHIPDHNIRPGHDRRYALSCEKMRECVGWSSRINLDIGLRETVEWYSNNPFWLRLGT